MMIEKYYSQKSIIRKCSWIQGSGVYKESLVTTKTSNSFVKKSKAITRNNMFINCKIKDGIINVSIKKTLGDK